MIHPKEEIPKELKVSHFSKARECEIVSAGENDLAQVVSGTGNTTIRYWVGID